MNKKITTGKVPEVRIKYDLMKDEPSGTIIVNNIDITSLVIECNINWKGGDMPEIELKIIPEKLDIHGKLRDLKTIKLLEEISESSNE